MAELLQQHISDSQAMASPVAALRAAQSGLSACSSLADMTSDMSSTAYFSPGLNVQ